METLETAPFCHIEMLGGLRVTHADRTLTRFPTQKAGALLAYLALRAGRMAPREHLLDLFWPDMESGAGRDNLSTTLGTLRRMLEPPGIPRGGVLAADRTGVGLNTGTIATDVAGFEAILGKAEREADPVTRARLRGQAADLYGGEFLPGCYLDWAVCEGERLQARHLGNLEAWASDLEAAGEAGAAADAARRWTEADPFSEEAGATLVRLLMEAGRSGEARSAFGRLERMLDEEYGARPSAEIRLLVDALASPHTGEESTAGKQSVARRSQHPAMREAADPLSSFTLPTENQTEDGPKTPSAAPPGLPALLSRFFGREAELALLARLLPCEEAPPGRVEGATRLVTLTGPGGMGKTRLAAEFIRRASASARQTDGRHSLWTGFAALAELTDAGQILPQIAQTLRLAPAPDADPLDRVAAFFAAQAGPCLLVLDNLEQIAEAGPIVGALLERAPNLACLSTSRRRLGLRGERLLPLAPLAVPDGFRMDGVFDPEELLGYPSVRLYTDRAQAVRPDFQVTAGNAEAVSGLCRALEGSPLALELAASWVRSVPPRKMWERLARDLGGELATLEGRYDDLPARHRSLWAALDWSWRLLTDGQRRLLARLSVFRGGWTAGAAETVCEEPAAERLLAELQEASLVTAEEDRDGEARFGLLETVRQYAQGRLAEMGEVEAARGRHLAWCLMLALQAEPALRGPQQGEWLARLEAEHDNLRMALDWAAQGDDRSRSDKTGDCLMLSSALGLFWLIRGHHAEGRTRLAAALARQDAQILTLIRAEALNQAAMLATEQGDLSAARALHEEGLTIRRALGDPRQLMSTLNNMAIAVYDQGDIETARTLWKECLEIARTLDFAPGIASASANLGELAFDEGDTDTARPLLEEAVALDRMTGRRFNLASTLNVLAAVARRQGDLPGARRILAECLPLQHELGYKVGVAQALETVVALMMDAGEAGEAARTAGAAGALRASLGASPPANERARLDPAVAAAKAALGDATFAAVWAEGQAMTWEQAVEDTRERITA